MNKANLIDKMASDADITKTAAATALDSLLGSIASTLSQGGKVTLVGFGTYSVSHRKARTGRNPQTGEEIQISASRTVGFKPAPGLKKGL